MGVLRILDRSPFAPGAPREAGCVVGLALCGGRALSARAAIVPVPKKENRFLKGYSLAYAGEVSATSLLSDYITSHQ